MTAARSALWLRRLDEVNEDTFDRAMDLVVLQCARCGGALPPEASKGAVKCPHCDFVSAPLTERHDIVTVLVQQVTAGGPSSQSGCPRCAVPLFCGIADEITLEGCGVCGGIWLDNEATQAIANVAAPHAVELADRAAAHATVKNVATNEDLPCPVCHATMVRASAGAGIVIDICNAHGTWLDAGELRAVVVERMRLADEASRRSARQLEIAAATPAESDEYGRGAAILGAALFGVLSTTHRR